LPQWFNGGIGTKRGLPNLLGCAVLPSLANVNVDGDGDKEDSSSAYTTYNYTTKIRPLLSEWMADCVSTSTPWDGVPEEVFGGKKTNTHTHTHTIDPDNNSDANSDNNDVIIGSPVLDWLVTGDPTNLQQLRMGLMMEVHQHHPDSNSNNKKNSHASGENGNGKNNKTKSKGGGNSNQKEPTPQPKPQSMQAPQIDCKCTWTIICMPRHKR
jgi:hypothetical protein